MLTGLGLLSNPCRLRLILSPSARSSGVRFGSASRRFIRSTCALRRIVTEGDEVVILDPLGQGFKLVGAATKGALYPLIRLALFRSLATG